MEFLSFPVYRLKKLLGGIFSSLILSALKFLNFFLLKIFNLSILGNFLWLVPQTGWSRTKTSKI